MGLLGREGGEGAAGECTMKGLRLPSDQPETQGAVTGAGGGERRGGLSFPTPSPKRRRAWGLLGSRLGPRQNLKVIKPISLAPQESDDRRVSCSPRGTPTVESQAPLELLTARIDQSFFPPAAGIS